MRRHHTGSGRRHVIPATWSDDHAGILTDTYEATITIRNPQADTRTFNDSTGVTDTVASATAYTGPASLVLVSDPQLLQVVDQPDYTTLFQVLLPEPTTGIGDGYVVHVNDSPDPMLDGKDLTIHGVLRGDRRFARVLNAVLSG